MERATSFMWIDCRPVESARSDLTSTGIVRNRTSFRQSWRSEEHTSDSSHANISYAVFCLKKKKSTTTIVYSGYQVKTRKETFTATNESLPQPVPEMLSTTNATSVNLTYLASTHNIAIITQT